MCGGEGVEEYVDGRPKWEGGDVWVEGGVQSCRHRQGEGVAAGAKEALCRSEGEEEAEG